MIPETDRKAALSQRRLQCSPAKFATYHSTWNSTVPDNTPVGVVTSGR